MAVNLMKRAAMYRKQHKSLSMAEAVKKVAAMDRGKKTARKKPAARKKAAPKKRAVGKVKKKRPAAKKTVTPRKVKLKIRPGKKGTFNLGISGVAHNKMGTELQHQHSLTTAMNKHKEMLKAKGLKPAEKAQIRRDIAHYKNAIAASKKHISALKRSL